jgi:thiol-disulfide isomerase/thioredoxin
MIKIIIIFTTFSLISSQSFARGIEDFEHDTPVFVKDIQFIDENIAINNLNQFRGKVVLLNFWATWCKPCVDEMPALSRLQENVEGRDVKIIPLSIDYKGIEAVQEFYKTNEIKNLPTYLDRNGTGFKAFELRALPTTIIINKKGQEVARVLGEIDWSGKDVKDYLIRLTRK